MFCCVQNVFLNFAAAFSQPLPDPAYGQVYTRSQHQKRLNLFGWVAPAEGLHGMMKWARGNTDGFLRFLRASGYVSKGKSSIFGSIEPAGTEESG
jgi:hypothetical protein